MKIDTQCRNKKCSNVDACSGTGQANFLVETNSFALFDLFTNTEKLMSKYMFYFKYRHNLASENLNVQLQNSTFRSVFSRFQQQPRLILVSKSKFGCALFKINEILKILLIKEGHVFH